RRRRRPPRRVDRPRRRRGARDAGSARTRRAPADADDRPVLVPVCLLPRARRRPLRARHRRPRLRPRRGPGPPRRDAHPAAVVRGPPRRDRGRPPAPRRAHAMTDAWPELPPLTDWEATVAAVHMGTRVAGRARLELGPPLNHSWGVALYVTPRGLATGPVPHGARSFEITFDFVAPALRIAVSDGSER